MYQGPEKILTLLTLVGPSRFLSLQINPLYEHVSLINSYLNEKKTVFSSSTNRIVIYKDCCCLDKLDRIAKS